MAICNQCRVCASNATHTDDAEKCAWCQMISVNDCVDRLAQDRNAWKTACSYIMSVLGEGGRRGRPMDLIDKSSWHRIQILIGMAKEGLGDEDMEGHGDV